MKEKLADGVGFEPTDLVRSPVFKAGALSQTLPTIQTLTKGVLYHLSYIDAMWSPGRESNPRPAAYKAAALASELPGRKSAGDESGAGISLLPQTSLSVHATTLLVDTGIWWR